MQVDNKLESKPNYDYIEQDLASLSLSENPPLVEKEESKEIS